MNRLKRLLIGLMVLLLMMPSMAGAQEQDEKEIRAGEISVNLEGDSAPKRQMKGEKDQYLNPDDYPLINEGGFVDSLIDNKYASHRITFKNVSNDTNDRMVFNIEYMSSTSIYKDRYLDINFYKELNGSLHYVGTSEFDTYGYNSANLGTRMSKSLYDGQPYIYVRIGVYGDPSDQYYSDVTLFKVKNPFHVSPDDPPEPPAEGKYALISNESVAANDYQYTGIFSINNDEYTLDKKLDPAAYRLDVNIPFDTEKYADKKLEPKSAKKSLNVVGDSKSFWVVDFTDDRDYQIDAKLLYSGTKTNVWVHDNQITSADARKLGQEFDQNIHPVVTENFANESDVDGDGKINILCFDIQDGFYGYGGYVAGYFYSRDLYNVAGSNKSEIFYIDTYPLMGMGSVKNVTAAYNTLAHEFQHMVNFNQNVFVENGTSMDTWLNEGLSMAAEQIYSGQVLKNRIDYYNRSNSITAGHSLLYWDYSGDTLSNYSLSYLFGQYVKAQAGQGDRIFKEILADRNNNYRAVENAAKNYIDPSITFGKLMTNFRGALFMKEKTGVYGFNGDPGFDGIERKLYSGSSTFLRGGGAIVRQTNGDNTIPAYKGEDITYTFFDDPVDQTPPAKPVVEPVSDQDTVVRGTAEAKSTVYVKAGSEELGNAVAGSNQSFSVGIPKQKAGTVLTVYAVDEAGNRSESVTVTVEDKTPPSRPVVSPVSDQDKVVRGSTEAEATVTVKKGAEELGTAVAGKDGKFSVTMPSAQKAGNVLTVYAVDEAGNQSESVTVTVEDKTPPSIPAVSQVSDKDKRITGKAEAESTITVKAGKQTLGTTTATKAGNYTFTLKSAQKAGTVLYVTATDKAGNVSKARKVTVLDKTPPSVPTVSKVSNKDKKITGKAEAGSKVTVKAGKKILGSATATKAGNYTITLKSAQKAGTVLYVTATDKAKNTSKARKVTVIDKIPPAAPKVNKVTIRSTTVKGKAEANSTVYVKVGKKVIGSAKANKKGNFSVKIKKQKAGTTLLVYAKDKAGNTSKTTKVKVQKK